jgi:hypothetical protein
MKNIIFLVLFSLIATLSFSQSTIENFYQKYTDFDNVTDIKLQGWLLKLASQYSDDEEANKFLEKITQLRVLIMEEGNLVSPYEYKSLKRNIVKENFEELFQVREQEENIGLYIREQGDKITDVVLLVSGVDNFVLLSLEGLLKFSDLNDLKIDVEGIEHLEKLPDDKKDVPRA